MTQKQTRALINNHVCGEGHGNETRIKLEKEALSLIASLSDGQLLKIMREMSAHPAP